MSVMWQALKPWAGLIAAVAGAAVAHQFGAFGTFDHCPTISPGPLLAVAAVCLLAVIAAAWVSAQVARLGSESGSRRLVAVVSVGMAALVVFATVLPMIAALTLPRCFQ
jgi:hypothetical protein